MINPFRTPQAVPSPQNHKLALHLPSPNLMGKMLFYKNDDSYEKNLLLIFVLATVFAKAQSWQTIGSQQQIASGTSSYTSITTVLSGTASVPYVVYVEGGIARVKKYANGTWSQAGGDVATGSPTYTRIIADEDGNLFVSYVDAANGNRLAVKILNLQTGVWEPINGNAANLYKSTGSVTFSISQYSATPRSQMLFGI